MKTQHDIDLLREYEAKGLITGREHPDYELVVWNYTAATQYGRLWDEVTRSTRGLVTDMRGRTVAQCLPKFFNLPEPESDGSSIDDFTHAQEKLDGSLIHVFNYEGNWIASSRGSFESDQAKWAQELVVSQIDWFNAGHLDFTYVCELIVPENRIVVDYEQERSLRLIAMFTLAETIGWFEVPVVKDFMAWPWDIVTSIGLDDLDQYLDQSGIEGVVLVNFTGDKVIRAKIKTDEYVEHHRIVTGLTTKSVMEHYMEHDSVDLLLEVAPDEWYHKIGQLAWAFETSANFIEAQVRAQFRNVRESLSHDYDRKEFAVKVKAQRNAKYLFRLLDGKPIRKMTQREVLDNYELYKLDLHAPDEGC